jgi:hypothetical protein
LASRGAKRLSDITGEARRARDLLDQLDEDESANTLSALRFAAPGDTVKLGRYDLMVKGPNDVVVIECKSFGFLSTVGDQSRPRRRPATLIIDEEAGAHWRALPVYARRPFSLEACCAMAVPASVPAAVASPSVPAATATPADTWAFILLHISAEYPPRGGLGITTQDRRLVRDCHEGLRRFLDGVLALLGFMIVTLLAALSHQTQAPAFLLVILAAARRYGRRGDADGHLLPAPALQPEKQQGTVCLAA